MRRRLPHLLKRAYRDRFDFAVWVDCSSEKALQRAIERCQEDLPPATAREQLGPAAVVGFSTHTMTQIEAALREPISYVAVGPVFGTSTKETGYPAIGLTLVSEAARLSELLPVVAIGGVTLANARFAIDAGASSVAVISDLLVGNPSERVKAFLRILE